MLNNKEKTCFMYDELLLLISNTNNKYAGENVLKKEFGKKDVTVLEI